MKTETTKHCSAEARILVPWPRTTLLFGMVLALAGALVPARAQEDAKPPAENADAHQASYAVIFGTVWDPDSRPVYGVHVQLRRVGDRKVRWEAFSDHHGEFAFRVPAGKMEYELTADPKSLKSMKNRHLSNPAPVKIQVQSDERVDTGLHLSQ
jgi:hypothetical protein